MPKFVNVVGAPRIHLGHHAFLDGLCVCIDHQVIRVLSLICILFLVALCFGQHSYRALFNQLVLFVLSQEFSILLLAILVVLYVVCEVHVPVVSHFGASPLQEHHLLHVHA